MKRPIKPKLPDKPAVTHHFIEIKHRGREYAAVGRYESDGDLLFIGTPDGLAKVAQLAGSEIDGLMASLLYELVVENTTG